jgi:hypothetical protein
VITPELRGYAETPDRYALEPSGSITRCMDDRVCIVQGPTWAMVSGVRTDDVDALVREVRERVPAEKEPRWEVGPSAEPADLVERLQELGLRDPPDGVTVLHAVVATEPPAEAPGKLEVREIRTFDDFSAAAAIGWEAFETPAHRVEADRRRMREDFDDAMRSGNAVGFVAILDGRPAATAMSVPSPRGVFLIGAATAPWARGRGLYRALVRARWDDAVRRGTPALVTHANPDTSLPILARLGFVEVCRIRRLQDVR